jgi:hypothetical protein
MCQAAKQQKGGGSCELTFIGEFKRMVERLPWNNMMLLQLGVHYYREGHHQRFITAIRSGF